MHAFGSLIVIVSLLGAAQPDQAAAVLAAARAALGGEARIAGVRTFIASGRTRQIRGNNLVPIDAGAEPDQPPQLPGLQRHADIAVLRQADDGQRHAEGGRGDQYHLLGPLFQIDRRLALRA